MTDTLDKAIRRLKSLPAERQRAAAALIEQFIAADEETVYVLGDQERALVEKGLAELDRGDFVTQSEHNGRIAKILKQ